MNTPGNEQRLKTLMMERKRLEEALTLKQNNINIQNNLNNEKDKKIRDLEEMVTGLRDK